MTNSNIFKAAHKIARNTVRIVGNYSIAFSLALKSIYNKAVEVMAIKSVDQLSKGDKLTNTNHGFDIEIVEIGKKNTRYRNLETGEKVKSLTQKFNFMLREGVFVAA